MAMGAFAQVGVGTLEPDNSAILDLSSSTKGFLPPRMNDAARDALASPAAGLVIFNTDTECLNIFDGTIWKQSCGSGPWPDGYVHCNGEVTKIVEVTSTVTGRVWMDRNLGATEAARDTTTANTFGGGFTNRIGWSNDVPWPGRPGAVHAAAMGSTFQWGRFADGHQCLDSPVLDVTNRSSTSSPGHGSFILGQHTPTNVTFFEPGYGNYTAPGNWLLANWMITFNKDLWKGVNGVNNPCPEGFRVPSLAEWEAEKLTTVGGTLKLGLSTSFRGIDFISGVPGDFFASTQAKPFWWTTDVSFSHPNVIRIFSVGGAVQLAPAFGASVRCIKD
jgi:hypothetical protein